MIIACDFEPLISPSLKQRNFKTGCAKGQKTKARSHGLGFRGRDGVLSFDQTQLNQADLVDVGMFSVI